MHLRPDREDHLCGLEAECPKGRRWVEKSLGTRWNRAKNRARASDLAGPYPFPGGTRYHGTRAPVLAELGRVLTELTWPRWVCSRALGQVGGPREALTARPAALSRQVHQASEFLVREFCCFSLFGFLCVCGGRGTVSLNLGR